MKPRSNDDEEFWAEEESSPEALSGSPPHDVGNGELGTLLVQMCSMLTSTLILLSEADEDEFRAVSNRLAAFLSLSEQLKEALPKQRRPLGFRVQNPKRLTAPKQPASRRKRKRR